MAGRYTVNKMELTYIIQKSRRRSIAVSVLPDNRILVKAPYGTPESMVQEFLITKKSWIINQLERQSREVQKAESLEHLSDAEIKQFKKKACSANRLLTNDSKVTDAFSSKPRWNS